MSITMKHVTMTPELAQKYLELNTGNRHLRQHIVDRYAADMKNGRWKLNGEAIKVTPTRLLDGQHRLWAVIESECSIRMLVVEGIDDDAFDTIDTGLKRQSGDVLAFAGIPDRHNVAAATSVLIHYLNNNWKCANVITPAQVLEQYYKTPEILDAVRMGVRKGIKQLVPCSYIAPLLFFFMKKSYPDAEYFANKLGTGEEMSGDNPIMVLRNRLLGRRKMPNTRFDRYCVTGMVIKAWNAYRNGKLIKNLHMTPDDVMPEIV